MTSKPPRNALRLACAATLALAACTGQADAIPDTTTPTTRPVITVPPTTPTTTEPPTTPTTSPEDAVRDVHTRFMTELFARDERVTGPEAMLPLAEELTTGRVLNRIRDNVASRLATGERRNGPGYESNIVSVEIRVNGLQASVIDCSLGRGEDYSADGEVIDQREPVHRYRRTDLVRINGAWLVEEFFTGGEEQCDPTEL